MSLRPPIHKSTHANMQHQASYATRSAHAARTQRCFVSGQPPNTTRRPRVPLSAAFAQSQQAQQQHTNYSHTTYIHRSVRADEHVETPGNLVVHGDVAADASIEAAGDVMVWGRLSGHVHAGCTGNTSAVISALELRDAQIVIANSTSLGAARITVPGPHTASVQHVGRSISMNLTPLGPAHPALNPVGLTSSVKRWLEWYPAAAAALVTGCYALLAGLALLLAPKTVLGLLFDCSQVPKIWIRVGGVLFATFGGQYLGTAVADYRQVHAASMSSSGCPDMPFRPASPHTAGAAVAAGSNSTQTAQPAAPPTVAATYQQQRSVAPVAAAAAGAGVMSSTAAALLHDSSSAYVDFNAAAAIPADSRTSSSNGDGFSPSSSTDSSSSSDSRQVGRSVPADLLTKQQIEALRQQHKRQHKAAQQAAADAHGKQQQKQQQPQQQQPHLQQPPPTWAYSSSGFYEASVWSRLGLAATFTLLVLVCQGPPGLLVLALVNLFGALSMWCALRRQWLMHVMGDMPSL